MPRGYNGHREMKKTMRSPLCPRGGTGIVVVPGQAQPFTVWVRKRIAYFAATMQEAVKFLENEQANGS
jgi:hypothetical protein